MAENKFTLEDRFRYGNFEVNEVCELKSCSRSKIYQDRGGGLVKFDKAGSKTAPCSRPSRQEIYFWQ